MEGMPKCHPCYTVSISCLFRKAGGPSTLGSSWSPGCLSEMQMPRPHPKPQNTLNWPNFRVRWRNVRLYRAHGRFSCTHSWWTIAHKLFHWSLGEILLACLLPNINLRVYSHLRLCSVSYLYMRIFSTYLNVTYFKRSTSKVFLPQYGLIYSDLSQSEFFL